MSRKGEIGELDKRSLTWAGLPTQEHARAVADFLPGRCWDFPDGKWSIIRVHQITVTPAALGTFDAHVVVIAKRIGADVGQAITTLFLLGLFLLALFIGISLLIFGFACHWQF